MKDLDVRLRSIPASCFGSVLRRQALETPSIDWAPRRRLSIAWWSGQQGLALSGVAVLRSGDLDVHGPVEIVEVEWLGDVVHGAERQESRGCANVDVRGDHDHRQRWMRLHHQAQRL